MSEAKAYWSNAHQCWYVPVAAELMKEGSILRKIEHATIELRDGQLWITEHEPEGGRSTSPT
jgi:hypothetical protein